MSSNQKSTGTVKFFHTRQGWGIITSDQGDDCFVHYSAIGSTQARWKDLSKGDRVEFTKVQTERGYGADEVSQIS